MGGKPRGDLRDDLQKASLTFASGSLVGVDSKLVQFVVYCVLFVMMSANIENNSAVSEKGCLDSLWFLSGFKLGLYADQELLKSLCQNKTPD